MEGNIYNKISQEINFKLPDINFDSDSDDIENDKPIKPYIRPSADILFGWDSSENEEFMNILAKMPFESSVTEKPEIINSTEIVKEDDCPVSTTDKLPFMNISLPNGIRTHVPVEVDDGESRILLPNFGLRDNVDLDKVLDEMDLSNYNTTFFDDALTNVEDVEDDPSIKQESTSALLTRLDEMSRQYEDSRQNTNNNNTENYKKNSKGLSLSDLFSQLKYESARETVTIDLRRENNMWSMPINEETNKASTTHINEKAREEESSDEDEDDNKNELWIDSYRKLKHANKKNNVSSIIETQTTKNVSSQESTTETENNFKSVATGKVEEMVIESRVDSEQKIPEHVRIKIEKIKHREKVLSERRTIALRLSRTLPVSDENPLLIHEEFSFDPTTLSLLPSFDCSADGDGQLFRATILLSTPNNVMTMAKVPSPISSGYSNENFAATLSVLIQLTKVSNSKCPFKVLGLQQIYYDDQLQLSLLCRTDLSITNLKSDLKKYSLRGLMSENKEQCQTISDLPLSNLLRILPYNLAIDSNIWNWNNSSVIWKKMADDNTIYDDHHGCKPLDINTSCVVLQEDFFMSLDFYHLITKLLEKCSFNGIRLIYDIDGKKQLVFAVRGYDSVNIVKAIQNKLQTYRTSVTCTRFQESSLKELVKYFGRCIIDTKTTAMFQDDRYCEIANELSEGFNIYHSLYFKKPSDVVLVVSPMCLDIGWIIDSLLNTGGYRIVNVTRFELSISVARQLGINEQLVDSFECTNGPCHMLIIRNEQPMHSLKCALAECYRSIRSNDDDLSDVEQIFYSLPYSEAVLNLLDLQKITQTPSIRELVLNIPDAPFDDCEQCSFVLLISDELTRHLAQLLDQMSNLDLLAVKCMSRWPSDEHLVLIQSQFGLRLPILNPDSLFDETEGKMRICVLVVRSMFLIKELEKIQSTIRVEKNLIFAYTMNVSVTFGMVGSFFTSSELISDPRRRSALKFLPTDIISKLATVSVLAQFTLMYSSITSAMKVKINDLHSVSSKFRQLWFLLTREGFLITDVILDETMHLLFIVKRPNAIFYLIQWTKSHFIDDNNLSVATNSVDIDEVQSKICHGLVEENLNFLSYSGHIDNIAFIMLNESLLDSSPEMLSITKLFWRFLDENNYNIISMCLKTVNGSDIFKLNGVPLRNLLKKQIKTETRYLCLLVTGSIVAMVIEDLLKSKIGLLKTESCLSEEIYICCDNKQIIQCCNILMRGAVCNHLDPEICSN